MKTGNVSRILTMALSTAALAVYGCGGGGGGGGTTPTYTTQQTPGSSAAASGTQGASISSNVGQTLSGLAAPVGTLGGGAPKYRSPLAGNDARFNKMNAAQTAAMKVPTKRLASAIKKAKATGNKAPVAIPSTTTNCTDGGTMTLSGSVDAATGDFSMNMAFSQCREDDSQMNGTMTMNGALSLSGGDTTFDIILGDGDNLVEATDFKVDLYSASYTNLYARYTADMTMATTMNATGDTFSFTANGKQDYTDFTELYSMTYANLVITSQSTGASSGTDTTNGSFSQTWSSGAEGVNITFSNFVLLWTATSTHYETTIDGTVTTDFTPNNLCTEGTFVIDTTIPIKTAISTGETVAGNMTINTTTIIVFNADGSVTVTDSSGTNTYESSSILENTCPIQDFEDNTTSSTNVSGGGTQAATGSTMTITTLSSYPANSTSTLDCYTDLHVKYYDVTAPTSSTTEAWIVDWTSLDGCTSPAGSSFEQAYDITTVKDGICDVGLDINGSSTDVTSNGTEHFTALIMPVGYYVVSVNNFSCPIDVRSDVSIKIGSSLYTGYSGTYTASDGDGTTPGAWFRVADIKVNSDGSVNLMAPNTSLTPWHSSLMAVPANSPRKR